MMKKYGLPNKFFREKHLIAVNMKYVSILIILGCINIASAQSGGNGLGGKMYAKNRKDINYWKNVEVLSPESMLINGKVPCLTTVALLKAAINNPDNVTDDHAECCTYWESDYEKDMWYGKSYFLTFQDSAIVKELYLNDDRFYIKTPSFTFNKNTTFDDVCKAFPEACKMADEKIVKNISDGTSTKYVIIDVRMSATSDDIWTSYFKDNKLVFIGSGTIN